MKNLLQKTKWLCNKLNNLPIIGKYFGNIPLLCDMVRDYINGSYREVPPCNNYNCNICNLFG